MNEYLVNEIFQSIQGEGSQIGRPCVFVRMAGCNMNCKFCDTNHSPVFHLSEIALVERILDLTDKDNVAYIVFTGGEPLLQRIEPLAAIFRAQAFDIGLETNGTLPVNEYLFDYISLSPKVKRSVCRINECDSLKLLFPYLDGIEAEDSKGYASFPARHRYLQPIDKMQDVNETDIDFKTVIDEINRINAQGYSWKLGVQLHKLIGVK